MKHQPFSILGKKILITGASSGIGAQTAITASKLGAVLIITGRDSGRLETVLNKLEGKGHQAIATDLNLDTEALINACEGLNGIVNCAGVTQHLPIKFIDKAAIESVFNINYTAPVVLINQLFKKKKISAGASIVFLSSLASIYPFKGGTLYSGAKGAIDNFSKTIAIEFAPQKIRSNTINAGMVRTPLLDGASETISKEAMEAHEKGYPLGFGDPEDIANMAVFLLSDASKWVTGTSIIMDGGLTAGT
ncbi:MAG: SDR family oxidoreductase [Bacteroidetes bacterium]|nr:SDR family oxidoreductase [Bacteroidota bacterium]